MDSEEDLSQKGTAMTADTALLSFLRKKDAGVYAYMPPHIAFSLPRLASCDEMRGTIRFPDRHEGELSFRLGEICVPYRWLLFDLSPRLPRAEFEFEESDRGFGLVWRLPLGILPETLETAETVLGPAFSTVQEISWEIDMLVGRATFH